MKDKMIAPKTRVSPYRDTLENLMEQSIAHDVGHIAEHSTLPVGSRIIFREIGCERIYSGMVIRMDAHDHLVTLAAMSNILGSNNYDGKTFTIPLNRMQWVYTNADIYITSPGSFLPDSVSPPLSCFLSNELMVDTDQFKYDLESSELVSPMEQCYYIGKEAVIKNGMRFRRRYIPLEEGMYINVNDTVYRVIAITIHNDIEKYKYKMFFAFNPWSCIRPIDAVFIQFVDKKTVLHHQDCTKIINEVFREGIPRLLKKWYNKISRKAHFSLYLNLSKISKPVRINDIKEVYGLLAFQNDYLPSQWFDSDKLTRIYKKGGVVVDERYK